MAGPLDVFGVVATATLGQTQDQIRALPEGVMEVYNAIQ